MDGLLAYTPPQYTTKMRWRLNGHKMLYEI